jgi:hypothetical protein
MYKCAVVRFAISFVFVASLLCAAQAGKVESVGPLTDKGVPQGIRQALDTKGYRLTLDASAPFCELYMRKSIPSQPKKEVEGVAYPQLAESTMFGVIHFPKAAADFRGHRISAGFYTLRYELMPDDGNHLGAAPNRDFLLVIPAAADADPSATFGFQDLVAMSAQTSGTKHPSPLSLVETNSPSSSPATSKNDQGYWVFSSTMKLNSGEDLPFALVVEGTAQQ